MNRNFSDLVRSLSTRVEEPIVGSSFREVVDRRFLSERTNELGELSSDLLFYLDQLESLSGSVEDASIKGSINKILRSKKNLQRFSITSESRQEEGVLTIITVVLQIIKISTRILLLINTALNFRPSQFIGTMRMVKDTSKLVYKLMSK